MLNWHNLYSVVISGHHQKVTSKSDKSSAIWNYIIIQMWLVFFSVCLHPFMIYNKGINIGCI